ncbi:MAG: helix-turn-helix domain-containing protein [Rubrobacteraceae bacterium]
MGKRKRRQRLDHPHELTWEQLDLLCTSKEQRRYEQLRPLALFGSSVPDRAQETGVSERTLYRRLAAFGDENMLSLFDSPKAKRRVLPPNIHRAIIDLKAEHPPLNFEEIANICGELFERRPDGHTVKAILEENAIPARPIKRFASYHEIENDRERRDAVVTLHEEGWADKSIASYLKVHRSTVYRVKKRAEEIEGEEGLRDKPSGRRKGVQKADLHAMNEVRKFMENPELGEFRIHAALQQKGIYLSPRTVGRMLATLREAEGLEKPSRGHKEKKEMPFEASYRHEIWTSDVRYLKHSIPETSQVYVISILENYSRVMLASAVSMTQDKMAYLSVLHTAIERYGSPQKLVTDGGGVFGCREATAVYKALDIKKLQIEQRQPWQSYIETTFNIQCRMADFYFARAESWEELVEEHDRWLENYNTQSHKAHIKREDGKRSPAEVTRPAQRGSLRPGRIAKGILLGEVHQEARCLRLRSHKALASIRRRRTRPM